MQNRSLVLFSTILLVVMLFCLTFSSSACAPQKPQVLTAAEFYKQNTVTLVCPYKAGGGADLDARLFAARWGETTGGGVMVNINKEAAGGIEGANFVYSAKPDGLTLGHGGPSTAMYVPTLMGDPALKADITKVIWLGALQADPYLLAVGKHVPANSIEELKQIKGLKFATAGLSSAAAQMAAIVTDIFKLEEIKIVTGYGNPSEISIAIGKKEADVFLNQTQSYFLEDKKGFLKPPMLILSNERTAWYPDVKTLMEVTKPTPEQEKLLNLFGLSSAQGKAFFGPPGIPEDRVKFLRDAWNKISENKAFVAQMKELRYPVWEKPLTGEQVTAKAAQVVTLKPLYGTLADLVKKYGK